MNLPAPVLLARQAGPHHHPLYQDVSPFGNPEMASSEYRWPPILASVCLRKPTAALQVAAHLKTLTCTSQQPLHTLPSLLCSLLVGPKSPMTKWFHSEPYILKVLHTVLSTLIKYEVVRSFTYLVVLGNFFTNYYRTYGTVGTVPYSYFSGDR